MSDTTVIVGAGQAGLQTAVSLRQGGYAGRLLLLGSEAHLPYQRPPLSKQVLKGEFDADRCTLRGADFLAAQEIEFRPHSRAEALLSDQQQLRLADGQLLSYDALVIASGARLNRLHLPGSELDGVFYLRTIDDALTLRERLQAQPQVLIAGAGYIGLEVAASARALGCKVRVVEAQQQLMQRSALPAIADFMRARHEQEGVAFHFGRKLAAIHGQRQVQRVGLDDGTELDAELVVKGIGVRPDLRWLEGSGLATARGILVDDRCRTNLANVYAAGDCAETQHPLYSEPVLLESVQNAVSQGKTCAAAILGQDTSYSDVPWFWSEQFDCRIQLAGLPQPQDELVVRSDAPNSMTVLALGADRLHAIQCINAPRDYMAARKIIALGDAIDRDRLRNPKTELKELL